MLVLLSNLLPQDSNLIYDFELQFLFRFYSQCKFLALAFPPYFLLILHMPNFPNRPLHA